MPSLISSINFALDDLRVEGTDRFSEGEGFESNHEGVVRTAVALLERLHEYDNRLVLMDPASPTLAALIDAVKVREPLVGTPQWSENVEYRLLHLLCSHLQGERLLRHSLKGGMRREQAAETGKIVFQLDKMCNDLDVDTSVLGPAASDADILRLVSEAVSQAAARLPPGVLHAPPRVLGHLSLEQLGTEQLNMLVRVNEAYAADFLLRRQMLMKRLDVTIQSFLWGEKAQGKEGEVVAAIQAQRRHLSEEPCVYSVEDALRAPISLLHEHSKRVTDQGSRGKKSLVKTVIIGHIPDRGGRANEMRPKKSDMGFGGGGGYKGRGGGRGGGGGGGGRGGGRGGGKAGGGKSS